MPYTISTFIIAAFLGPLGFYLADVLTYLDPAKAASAFINNSVTRYSLSQIIGNTVVYPAIIFYCAYMLRYMRRRISEIEEKMEAESPEWAGVIRDSFGGISSTGPALAVTGVILLLSLPLIVFQVSNSQGLAQLYFAITYPLFFFAAGSFIWMYVRSLWGLYKIGTQPLNLKQYSEDKLLGLGGFGRISLTLTTVFLVAVFLAVYEFTVYASAMPVLLTISFSGALVLLGVCMFFLPLLNLHSRMIAERDRLRYRNMKEVLQSVSPEATEKGASTVNSLHRIVILEHEAEEIRTIPSWPFDIVVIRSLAGVVFGVVISISAHILIVVLKI